MMEIIVKVNNREVAAARLINDGTGTHELGNYIVEWYEVGRTWRRGSIGKAPRYRSPLRFAARVLSLLDTRTTLMRDKSHGQQDGAA